MTTNGGSVFTELTPRQQVFPVPYATDNWTINTSWATSNGTNSLIINNPSGNLFFRLK